MQSCNYSQPGMANESIIIAICTYNNAQLLDRTLATIEQQKTELSLCWSVLVIDNNSQDETPDVVQRYIIAGRIPGLRIVYEPCQGLAYARRRAVQEISSELIAFVDDDCLLSENWLQEAVIFYREHPMAGAVGGKVKLLWDIPPEPVMLKFEGYLASQDRGNLTLQMPSTGNTYLVGAGLVVQRLALLASGWLDKMILVGRKGKALTAGDDTEMVLRIRNAGYELWYNPAMQLQHYIPQQRMSVDYLCRLLRGIGQSLPILSILGNKLKPTLKVRLQLLGESIKYLGRLVLSITYKNVLQVRPVSSEQQVYFYNSIGYLEGSLKLLFQKSLFKE